MTAMWLMQKWKQWRVFFIMQKCGPSKQPTVARSSIEAEYRALADLCCTHDHQSCVLCYVETDYRFVKQKVAVGSLVTLGLTYLQNLSHGLHFKHLTPKLVLWKFGSKSELISKP